MAIARIHIVLIALTVWAALCPAERAAAKMYYYKDAQGNLRFTNLPETVDFKLFAVFRDIDVREKDEILASLKDIAGKYDLDHRLVRAVIEVESAFNNEAVSSKGAQGLMQIMPQTGKELGLADPFDAMANIDAGCRYLRGLMDRFDDLPFALAAYNAGPGAVERYKGIPPYKETQRYVKKVLAAYRAYKSLENRTEAEAECSDPPIN